MNPIITPEIQEVMKAVHYRPAVSIIMPFESKSNMKTELVHSLKLAADKVEKELEENYPGELSQPVMEKLRELIRDLEVDGRKKSIAIFVSPIFQKVMFLDMVVEEKIIIDETFEIRDLVYCKKQLHKYLALLLSGKESRLFLGNSDRFVRMALSTPETVADYLIDSPERVANFSDISEQKEIVMEKFLHHIDKALDRVLYAYHIPLFVLGTDRILGHFKKLTRHGDAVTKYVAGNYEEATFPELKQILEPHMSSWKKEKQLEMLSRLEKAASDKELAIGVTNVWREAMHQKGRLLVVEKNYMYPAQHGSSADVIYRADEATESSFYIKDAVDGIIEKVLENGGDVEFVEEGLLKDYQHIALVQYY